VRDYIVGFSRVAMDHVKVRQTTPKHLRNLKYLIFMVTLPSSSSTEMTKLSNWPVGTSICDLATGNQYVCSGGSSFSDKSKSKKPNAPARRYKNNKNNIKLKNKLMPQNKEVSKKTQGKINRSPVNIGRHIEKNKQTKKSATTDNASQQNINNQVNSEVNVQPVATQPMFASSTPFLWRTPVPFVPQTIPMINPHRFPMMYA
jgi:hypothetical protein